MGLGVNKISGAVVNLAMCVHNELGQDYWRRHISSALRQS
jgi:hypothetical protein